MHTVRSLNALLAGCLVGASVLVGCGSAPEPTEKSGVDQQPLCPVTQGEGNVHFSSLCNPYYPPPPRTPPPPPSPPSIFLSSYTGATCGGHNTLAAANLAIPSALAGHGCSGGIAVTGPSIVGTMYIWACPTASFTDSSVFPIGFAEYPNLVTWPDVSSCDNVLGAPNVGNGMELVVAGDGTGPVIGGGCRGSCQ